MAEHAEPVPPRLDQCPLLRPVLRSVKNTGNLDRVGRDLIDHDLGQRRKCQFTASSHATAGSSEIGKILQAGTAVIDGPGYALELLPGLSRVIHSQMRSKSSAAGRDQRTSIKSARTVQGAGRLAHE